MVCGTTEVALGWQRANISCHLAALGQGLDGWLGNVPTLVVHHVTLGRGLDGWFISVLPLVGDLHTSVLSHPSYPAKWYLSCVCIVCILYMYCQDLCFMCIVKIFCFTLLL